MIGTLINIKNYTNISMILIFYVNNVKVNLLKNG